MGTKRSLCCKAQEGWFGSLQNVTLAWCVVRVHGDYIQLQYIIVHPCNVHPLNIPKPWIPYLKMLGSSDKCLPNGPYGWGGKRWFGWHMVTCDTGESCSTSQLPNCLEAHQAAKQWPSAPVTRLERLPRVQQTSRTWPLGSSWVRSYTLPWTLTIHLYPWSPLILMRDVCKLEHLENPRRVNI